MSTPTYSTLDVFDEFRDDDTADYCARRKRGGLHSREGLEFEGVCTIRLLMGMAVECLTNQDDGSGISFRRGPYGFVDDLEIVVGSTVHRYECKSGATVAWGEAQGKTVAGNFLREATMLKKMKKDFALHLLMANERRARELADCVPAEIGASVTISEFTRFAEAPDTLSSMGSYLYRLCEPDVPPERHRLAAKTLLGAIHGQQMPATLGQIMTIAPDMSDGTLRDLEVFPLAVLDALRVLEQIPGIVSDKKRFFLSFRQCTIHLQYPRWDIRQTAPFRLDDPRFVAFIETMRADPPTDEAQIMAMARMFK